MRASNTPAIKMYEKVLRITFSASFASQMFCKIRFSDGLVHNNNLFIITIS